MCNKLQCTLFPKKHRHFQSQREYFRSECSDIKVDKNTTNKDKVTTGYHKDMPSSGKINLFFPPAHHLLIRAKKTIFSVKLPVIRQEGKYPLCIIWPFPLQQLLTRLRCLLAAWAPVMFKQENTLCPAGDAHRGSHHNTRFSQLSHRHRGRQLWSQSSQLQTDTPETSYQRLSFQVKSGLTDADRCPLGMLKNM